MRTCVTQLCVIQHRVMNNPFEFGRELGTEELVDRDDDVAVVVQTIRQRTKPFLVSIYKQLRYGRLRHSD
jgi:hypothetical protein